MYDGNMSIEYLNNLCKGCFAELHPGNSFCPVCGYDQNSVSDSSYQLPPCTILNGKFVVGKVLGEGGFGITYIGHDLNLQVKVAIKEYYPTGFVSRTSTVSTTVQPASGEHGEFFKRGRDKFVDEARRLAKFSNLPGIVMVKDFFIENGTAYIVMEFVEGQTLKDYLAQTGGRLPPDQVLEMLKPVFTSLSQIHKKGIIHRDISPDNLMISRDGSLKLLDFGAAREFGDDGQKSMSVMLKHGYAPMEQYSTKGEQGAHTDVYALSATIYKVITGVTPESSMDRLISDTVQPPSTIGIYLPGNQEFALMKGLALRQEDRYQSIPELTNALFGGATQPVQQQYTPPVIQPVPLQPPVQQPPPPPVLSKKTISIKSIIGFAAILVCVVIAFIYIYILSGDSPNNDGKPTPNNTNTPPIIAQSIVGAWSSKVEGEAELELVFNENGRYYVIIFTGDSYSFIIEEGTYTIEGSSIFSSPTSFEIYYYQSNELTDLGNREPFAEDFLLTGDTLHLTDKSTKEQFTFTSTQPSDRWSFSHRESILNP